MYWRLRRVRKADIPKTDRDLFEKFGVSVVQNILTGGFSPRHKELVLIYGDYQRMENAAKWLTEQGDKHENKETMEFAVEFAILSLFVVDIIIQVWVRN